ncbi:MAG TPA: peptidylprolyl isomerase [Acidimicrobiales bacterium]|nr:peptidylprolyl isomerase [Acidimicrobiales bacterium]
MKTFFRFLLVSILFVVSACGSSSRAIEVGRTSLDREALNDWIIERGYYGEAGAVENLDVSLGVIQQLIEFEALVDLLADHEVIPSDEDLQLAEEQLLTNGFETGSPVLERLKVWQSALNLANEFGSGVQAAYEAHAHLAGHDLCTSHILVSTRQEADELINSVNSGADFSELAITFSQDPGSGSQGGGLGCVTTGAFVPEFERAVLGALQQLDVVPGETVIGPVQSQFGFHIIRIDELKPVTPPTFEEAGQSALQQLVEFATMTRSISLDARYGSWDSVIGKVNPPSGPVNN